MRTKIFVVLASVFLGSGLLSLAPSANPKTAAEASDPVQTTPTQPATFDTRVEANKNGSVKPIAIWTCMTSWYGEDFDGQPTADGETYDMYGDTAAHPTLPLGSIVRVVNPKNDRSQVVRINDRGPYIEGRELDVSYEVARRLGFEQTGLARVRLELLKVPQRPSPDHHN